MDKLHDTLRRVEEYAAIADTTPEAVCRAATGNPRLYERLRRRAEYTESVISLIDSHMASNPVAPKNEAGAT